jgi:uncharacterized membrane protein
MKEDVMFKRTVTMLVALALPIALAAEEPPLMVVAQVLSLSGEQAQALGNMVQARAETLRPAVQQVQAREQALARQLQSTTPDPQMVGHLVIEIRQIQEQIHHAIEETNDQFELLLTPDQRARLEQIRAAVPACGVIPAFKALGLV